MIVTHAGGNGLSERRDAEPTRRAVVQTTRSLSSHTPHFSNVSDFISFVQDRFVLGVFLIQTQFDLTTPVISVSKLRHDLTHRLPFSHINTVLPLDRQVNRMSANGFCTRKVKDVFIFSFSLLLCFTSSWKETICT